MAENFFIDNSDKAKAYKELTAAYSSIIADENNIVARLSTLISLLTSTFGERFFWCGFYLVDTTKPNELVVGPYNGTLGCLRIPFGKGVCGDVASSQKSLLVDDVNEFKDHIACDSRSKSEIVIPVFDADKLFGVLDIDSTEFAAFDEVDRLGLEALCNIIFNKIP